MCWAGEKFVVWWQPRSCLPQMYCFPISVPVKKYCFWQICVDLIVEFPVLIFCNQTREWVSNVEFYNNVGAENRGISQLPTMYLDQLEYHLLWSLSPRLLTIYLRGEIMFKILSSLTFLFAFNSRRSIGVFAWGDSGTLRLVKGQ